MRVLQILFFLLLSQSIYAQTAEDRFTIKISALRGACMNCGFGVNIQRSPDHIKIVYAVKDSLVDARLRKNKEYAALLDQFSIAIDAPERDTTLLYAMVHQLDSIEIASFSKDSLVVKRSANVEYTNLIDKIFAASTAQLENNEANKNIIVLDGVTIKVRIQSASGNRTVYAHSPREASHPLLNELISKTMDLYREEKQSAFLDKRRTYNY